MKPSSFDYSKPDTVDEALDLLDIEQSNSRILAGGQSLAAMLNMRLVQPSVLIDISDLSELKTITIQNQTIQVGAAITQSELLAWDKLHQQPLLEKVLPWVGHYQTRQRGTICGSIAHSDPSSELPLALTVLGGSLLVRSKNGSRSIKASDFQIGPMQTSLKANEMITAAHIPIAATGSAFAFKEIGPRRGDFAITAVAAASTKNGILLGVAGVADVPKTKHFSYKESQEPKELLNAFAWELKGSDDVHATAKYRRNLVRHLGRDVINEVLNAVS